MVKAYLQRDEKTDTADAVVMHTGEATPDGTMPLDKILAQLTIERGDTSMGAELDVVRTKHRGALEVVAARRSDLELSDDCLLVDALHAMFGLTPDTGGLGGWTAILVGDYDLEAYHAELAVAATRALASITPPQPAAPEADLSTASPIPIVEGPAEEPAEPEEE